MTTRSTSFTGDFPARTSVPGATDGEQMALPGSGPASGGSSTESSRSPGQISSSSKTLNGYGRVAAGRTSALSWKDSTKLVTWAAGLYWMHSRSACQPAVPECSSWLETPGVLAVWNAGRGWRTVSHSTTLDASYSKGPDNHGQRTAVLPVQPPEATGF